MRDVTQQKLAEEMRDQFVDTATHELRTPLANIKAYAETLALADVIDVEQQKQFLNTINSEATRLARFVDDLLSVSSMELGSLSLNKQVTDLGRMLNEVLAKIRPQVEEKQLTLEVALPEKMPEPELDKDKIAAVLVNLLGNAVKYTPAGGRVTFRVNITDQADRDQRRGHGRGHRGGRTAQRCSTSSSAATTRACRSKPAPAWAWRWRRKSCGCTAARSRWKAKSTRAARLGAAADEHSGELSVDSGQL